MGRVLFLCVSGCTSVGRTLFLCGSRGIVQWVERLSDIGVGL